MHPLARQVRRQRVGRSGFARRADTVLHLENWVSCRVFGRGIEQACLAAVLGQARTAGLRSVYGGYRPTARNTTVSQLYPRYGFVVDSADAEGTLFRHDLTTTLAVPEHVRLHAEVPLSAVPGVGRGGGPVNCGVCPARAAS